ncbi:trypsin-5-like [Saccoglossus kowalevskii]
MLMIVYAQEDSGCGNERYMTGVTGTFTSMNFDGETPYDSFADCRWNIDIPNSDKVVELSFSHFDVEGSARCQFDEVAVHDGGGAPSPILERLCGHHIPFPISSTGPSMYVTFISDSVIEWTGFEAHYRSRDEPISCEQPTYLCGNDESGYCAPSEERCDAKLHCIIDELGCPGNRDNCGQPAITPNTGSEVHTDIVNGETAIPHSWPWQASLHNSKFHACGASILNEKWVITAAHCVSLARDNVYIFDVVAGEHNLTDPAPSRQEYGLEKIIVHAEYNPVVMNNDIALLKIRGVINMTAEISEICLPAQGTGHQDGDEAWITGWGDSLGTADERALQQAKTYLIDTAACNDTESYNGAISTNMVCAGYLEGGIDACEGDDGGPLVREDPITKIWYLYGITSWGDGCALAMKPHVYTKVSNYVDWINQMMLANP